MNDRKLKSVNVRNSNLPCPSGCTRRGGFCLSFRSTSGVGTWLNIKSALRLDETPRDNLLKHEIHSQSQHYFILTEIIRTQTLHETKQGAIVGTLSNLVHI